MNSAKSWDTKSADKNQVYFHILSNEHVDIKIKNTMPFTIAYKNKILRCKSNKTYIKLICSKLQNAKGNKSKNKQMGPN